jgi:hypothetical protein
MNLSERILDCFPSGSYALSGLLRLLDIEETTSVPTAAVECKVQPKLLMNPEFVAQHAQTPEKLLMLVMHELHHILLGHTTLFPRITSEQNFVFDAVINGIVCRMFPSPEHTAFFMDFYKADAFPECLLRPPVGWPQSKTAFNYSIASLKGQTGLFEAKLKEVHAALYSDAGASYKEVFEVLPKALEGTGLGDIPLLGGHRPEDCIDGGLEERSPLLFDIVRGVVESWPQPPDPIKGRSLADVLSTASIQPIRLPNKRHKLRALIKKVAGFSAHGAIRQTQDTQLAFTSPIPSVNRKSLVLQSMGIQPMLHSAQLTSKQRISSGEKVHVYVDVSGSMNSVLTALYGAVIDCEGMVHSKVHLFSNNIADISLAQLRSGVCITTGGTDIECVAKHIDTHKVRRALFITDGWVGKPLGRHHDVLHQTRLAVAYMGESTNTADLATVANFTTVLS